MFCKIDATNINGRNLELYFPLLITAQVLNELDYFLNLAKIKSEEKKEEEYSESKDISLIDFIATHGREEYVAMKDISSHFRLFVGDTGKDDENWVNEKWLGRALKRLNLTLMKRREASGRFVILNVKKAKKQLEMFKRANE